MEILIYEGADLNNFKIISRAEGSKIGWHKRWNVECKHCGRWLEKSSNDIKRQISCGCLKSLNADKPVDIRYKRLLRYHNKYEGIIITKDEFEKLSNSNCYYCNSEPSNFENGVKYSGIDRIDSNIGYVSNNVRSCCWICNRMKNNLTEFDFLNHIRRIFEAGKLNI